MYAIPINYFSDIFGVGRLESLAGNDKYIGFLIKRNEELCYYISNFEEFVLKPGSLEEKTANFVAGGPLKLIMPYLSQVSITSSNQIWLTNAASQERVDKILAAGAFDGQVAIITERGLKMHKTEQKISQNVTENIVDIRNEYCSMNNIEALEQMSQSEIPKERLLAAFIQFNQGNATEAGQLLNTIGDLDTAVSDVSREIIDEIPAQDPRWNRGGAKGLSSGNQSLLIQKQIQEKISKHLLFISFVKEKLSLATLAALSQVYLFAYYDMF